MASCWFFSGLASRWMVLLPGVREQIVHGLFTPIDRAAISSSTSYSGVARVWRLFQRWRTGRRCGDNLQLNGFTTTGRLWSLIIVQCMSAAQRDPSARSRRGWLLPERRRGVSLHLDLHRVRPRAQVVAERKPWREPHCAIRTNSFSRARWPSPRGASR